MRPFLVTVVSGLALAGCASGGGTIDWFPNFLEPKPVSIHFESKPVGAEAKTSTGQSCQTPCALALPPDKEFAVTFSLAGYQPQTVPVHLGLPEGQVGGEASLQPNPVAVELAKAAPAKRKPAKKTAAAASAARPAAPKPAAPQPAAAAPRPAAASPPPASTAPRATDPWPPVR